MYGFLLLAALLAINTLACGALFFAGQTGPILLLAISFFILYGLTAFFAGRGVTFRSPIAPRGATLGRRAAPARPRSAASSTSEFGLLE